MRDLLIRGVPDDVVTRLKERASRHRRSLQQELLKIITDSAYSSLEAYIAEVHEQRSLYRARHGVMADSTALIRNERLVRALSSTPLEGRAVNLKTAAK